LLVGPPERALATQAQPGQHSPHAAQAQFQAKSRVRAVDATNRDDAVAFLRVGMACFSECQLCISTACSLPTLCNEFSRIAFLLGRIGG
jgi:hypothetical protein